MLYIKYFLISFFMIASQLSAIELQFEPAFPKLSFARPLGFCLEPNNPKRAFVVEQRGKIWSFINDKKSTKKEVIFDISAKIGTANEEGLLCMVFHPQFPIKPYVFIYYSGKKPRRSIISRFRFEDGRIAPKSEKIILAINEPYGNHNGGQLAFGPDGFLYIGVGDGGWYGDPKKHGQNTSTLHSAILRIDIDRTANGKNYSIPKTNPFVNLVGKRQEIFAFGLRNPWRFSFDPNNGQLICADVGQNKFEEINIIKKGGNYGWPHYEGLSVYNKKEKLASPATKPLFSYPRNLGFSITGGFVYNGKILPNIKGYYIFCDYGSDRFWLLKADDKGRLKDVISCGTYEFRTASFALDNEGEIYLCSFAKNGIYKLVGTSK